MIRDLNIDEIYEISDKLIYYNKGESPDWDGYTVGYIAAIEDFRKRLLSIALEPK